MFHCYHIISVLIAKFNCSTFLYNSVTSFFLLCNTHSLLFSESMNQSIFLDKRNLLQPSQTYLTPFLPFDCSLLRAANDKLDESGCKVQITISSSLKQFENEALSCHGFTLIYSALSAICLSANCLQSVCHCDELQL